MTRNIPHSTGGVNRSILLPTKVYNSLHPLAFEVVKHRVGILDASNTTILTRQMLPWHWERICKGFIALERFRTATRCHYFEEESAVSLENCLQSDSAHDWVELLDNWVRWSSTVHSRCSRYGNPVSVLRAAAKFDRLISLTSIEDVVCDIDEAKIPIEWRTRLVSGLVITRPSDRSLLDLNHPS